MKSLIPSANLTLTSGVTGASLNTDGVTYARQYLMVISKFLAARLKHSAVLSTLAMRLELKHPLVLNTIATRQGGHGTEYHYVLKPKSP